jgi:phospholipid/cholesterol/gamma-HCH transport system permease protein
MRRIVEGIEGVGRVLLLLQAAGSAALHPRSWVKPAIHEAHRQITDAFWLVLLMGMLAGALITQQIGIQFEDNLPIWVIGAIVAASTIPEVTPLFTAFVLIGVVGTRVAAELGAMRVTEQVDALEVMGRDPVGHLVLPRLVGAVIAGPILLSFALSLSLIAGWLAAIMVTRATSADFWFGVRHYMRDFPLFYAMIKSLCFGFGMTLIASYHGLEATGGSEGVGRATRKAVVGMIVGILILDACLVPLLKWMRA